MKTTRFRTQSCCFQILINLSAALNWVDGNREKMLDEKGVFSEIFRSPDIHFISAFVFVMLGVRPLSIFKFMLLLTEKIKGMA